jgi:hypothetical protein
MIKRSWCLAICTWDDRSQLAKDTHKSPRGNKVRVAPLTKFRFGLPGLCTQDRSSLLCPMTAHLVPGQSRPKEGAWRLPWVMSTMQRPFKNGAMTSYTRVQPTPTDSRLLRTCQSLIDAGARMACLRPFRPVTAGWCSENLGSSNRTHCASLHRRGLLVTPSCLGLF